MWWEWHFVLPGTVPEPCAKDSQDWIPYVSQVQFETAKFLYNHGQISAFQIDTLCYLWAAMLCKYGDTPPYKDHLHLYHMINNTPLGDVK